MIGITAALAANTASISAMTAARSAQTVTMLGQCRTRRRRSDCKSERCVANDFRPPRGMSKGMHMIDADELGASVG